MRHLSPNRYQAEVMQQHAGPSEPPQSTQSVPQPAPEQSAESAPAPAVPAAQSAATPVQDLPSVPPAEKPYLDHAHGILAADTTLDDETRADAWDVYHNSPSLENMIQNLGTLPIPNSTKYALWQARSATAPAQSNVEKAANALQEMAKLDPQALALAEKYPHTLKTVLDAVKSDEE